MLLLYHPVASQIRKAALSGFLLAGRLFGLGLLPFGFAPVNLGLGDGKYLAEARLERLVFGGSGGLFVRSLLTCIIHKRLVSVSVSPLDIDVAAVSGQHKANICLLAREFRQKKSKTSREIH